MTGGVQGPSVDMKFAKYLALIVNKMDGYLGLDISAACAKRKVKVTPGPGCKNQSRESTLDNEQPEIPPSPPPRVQLTSQQAVTKGKGRATPRLGLKHQLASPPPPTSPHLSSLPQKERGALFPEYLRRKSSWKVLPLPLPGFS